MSVPSTPRVVSADAIDAALDFPTLIEDLRRSFAADLVAPRRHHHSVARRGSDATLLLMPAWTAPSATPAYLATKIVTVYPDNALRALPSVMGLTLLLDGETGTPLAVMDGARLTLWRTAATSALAARLIARPDVARMAMIGAGALAPFLIRAHRAARPGLNDVVIWNHRPERAQALAASLRADPIFAGLAITAEADAERAIRAADLVSCATLTTQPIVRGAWLKPGAHLDLVGAFSLSMREADDEALARGDILIDTQAALTEGGDIAVALRDGGLRHDRVGVDLSRLCRGETFPRASRDAVTIFKSIGAAIEDLAAAISVWERLRG